MIRYVLILAPSVGPGWICTNWGHNQLIPTREKCRRTEIASQVGFPCTFLRTLIRLLAVHARKRHRGAISRRTRCEVTPPGVRQNRVQGSNRQPHRPCRKFEAE
jgi:hypothetical protein